jgi:hypothetical protein
MNALKTLIRLAEPLKTGHVAVSEVRIYEDAWIETFYEGILTQSRHFLSRIPV